MTIEAPVETPESTENLQGGATETPEVVDPEKNAETEQKAEKTEAEILREELARKERQMQRRIDKLTKKLHEASYQQPTRTQPEPEADDANQPRYTEEEVQRKATERAQELLETERITQRANNIAANGEKEFPDFSDKVRAVMSEVQLFDQRGRMTPLMEIIAEADRPHALLHHLGSNPDLVDELADLSVAKQARRLALIEADLAKPKEPPTKQVSKAPKPIEPVKPAGRASDEPPIEDTKAWIEWSNRQDALKRLSRR